jgi:hypothetical protein
MACVGTQFSCGDQDTHNRKRFWRSGMSVCVKCKSRMGTALKIPAGRRENGTAYGTTVFSCGSDCDWTTSFLWDDAIETYYYETKHWRVEDVDKEYTPKHTAHTHIQREDERYAGDASDAGECDGDGGGMN